MDILVHSIFELIIMVAQLAVSLLFLLLNPLVFIPLIIYINKKRKRKKKIQQYEKGEYFKQTGLSYANVENDLGKYGEYLTYEYLKPFESQESKFLFNIYVPKEDGKTTEIDVIMIHPKGMFVIESKNYSGWIYGSEYQKNWIQTFKSGQKEYFYNPVMQNKNHISCLRKIFGYQMPMRSIIAFSDRCELKDIRMETEVIKVVNRYDIYQTVTDICNAIPDNILSAQDIEDIYKKLFPYTQVDESVKAQHVRNMYR